MLLSILTINLNNAVGLQQTISSVACQTAKNIEFILIDGNSIDESVKVIESANNITKWISEEDTGVYNAMNKAIELSTGDYLLFLNSGDLLYNANVLEKVLPELDGTGIVYGNLLIRTPGKTDWIKYYNEKLNFNYFTRDTLPHQGSFIRKELFEKLGMYDEGLKICADWKFFMEAICKHHVKVKYIDTIVSIYDYTGISSRPEYYSQQYKEKHHVLQNDYSLFYDSYIELVELRQLKGHYEDLTNNFFVDKIFALIVKIRLLKKKLKKYLS